MCRNANFTSQDHSTTQGSLEDLRNAISGTKEDLEDQLAQVRETISTADASIRKILQDDRTRLQESLASLAQAKRVSDTILPTVIIERNQAHPAARAIFGTDTSQPRFNLTVSNNSAALNSVTSSGVFTTETLQALLGNSTRSEPPSQRAGAKALISDPNTFWSGRKIEPQHIKNDDGPDNDNSDDELTDATIHKQQ